MNQQLAMAVLLVTLLVVSGCVSTNYATGKTDSGPSLKNMLTPCTFETAKERITDEIAMSRGECIDICSQYWDDTGKSQPERDITGFYFCNCYTCDESKAGMYGGAGVKETKQEPKCNPSWKCLEWSKCNPEGTQTRSCQDQNNCGTNEGKPPETQNCISEGVSSDLTLYDDFSVSSLDTTKWEESTEGNIQHYVDTTEGKFRVVQDVKGDSDHALKMQRKTSPGEVLQYDLYYSFGEGNRIHRAKFNGVGIQDLIGCSNCGAIGFWNMEASVGNQFGLYSIKYEFYENQIKATIVKPDESVWTETFNTASLTKPYEIWLATGTGHNGLIDVYFDNFHLG